MNHPKSRFSKRLSTWLAAMTFALAGTAASAGPLTGQQLTGTGLPFQGGPVHSVGAAVEFFFEVLGPTDGMRFDFDENGLLTVSLLRAGGGSHGFGGSFPLTFSDTNGTIPDIVGFSIVSVGPGITGVDAGDLSFTANSVTFNIGDTSWPGGNEAPRARFQIQFAQAVPEPTSLALLGLGFAGLAAVRRRRAV